MKAVTSDAYLSWGRIIRAGHRVYRPRHRQELSSVLGAVGQSGAVPFGLGRSYGDSNLNPDGGLIDMSRLDRFIAFDPVTGVLRAEAGVSLSAVLRFSVGQGWFLPTAPGSRFVTLGGAVANDVHGKNHHLDGTFGHSVRAIGLVRSDRGALVVTPESEPDLFQATIGGLGLTGLIAWVELSLKRIPSAFVDQETIAFTGLDGFFELAAVSAAWEQTVAWVDCSTRGSSLGRGVFTRGNWAQQAPLTAHVERPRISVPIDFPDWTLNPITLKAFNTAFYALGAATAGRRRVHYAQSLFPLDGIAHWNRLYGRSGFYQYQCVVPPNTARDAIAEMLDAIAQSHQGSFLAVLKSFGSRASIGLLSFPMPGVTLALDFRDQGQATTRLLAALDAIVTDADGRLYPAKDGRMPAAMFQRGYPHWRSFAAQTDPALTSQFWRRVSQ